MTLAAMAMVKSVGAMNNMESTDSLVFRPTKLQINLGTYYQPIEWKPVSPCTIDGVDDWYSANDVKKKAYDRLRRKPPELLSSYSYGVGLILICVAL